MDIKTEEKSKYENGKIYKIVSPDESIIYIGSTYNDLNKRMSVHRTSYKRYKEGKDHLIRSFDVFDYCGVDDAKIYLIEYCPCKTKEELNKREGEIIRTNNCVNRCIAGRTRAAYREEYKEHAKNRDGKNNTCEICGGKYTHGHKARHLKSQKHIKSI